VTVYHSAHNTVQAHTAPPLVSTPFPADQLLFIQETNPRLFLQCLAAGSADWHKNAVLWSFTELFRAGYAEPCYINS